MTSTRAPASASGTSPGTAAVTSTCSAPATSVGQPLAAVVVELGEHVVEDQHRLAAGVGLGRSRSYAASRSASANDQDSPWLA